MSREAVFYALLLEFIPEASLPPAAEVERHIRDAIERGLTPREFVHEFLDAFADTGAPKSKWWH